jgi:hypothetical protein
MEVSELAATNALNKPLLIRDLETGSVQNLTINQYFVNQGFDNAAQAKPETPMPKGGISALVAKKGELTGIGFGGMGLIAGINAATPQAVTAQIVKISPIFDPGSIQNGIDPALKLAQSKNGNIVMYGLVGGAVTYRVVEIVAPGAPPWVKWALAIVAGIALIAYLATQVEEKPAAKSVQGATIDSVAK